MPLTFFQIGDSILKATNVDAITYFCELMNVSILLVMDQHVKTFPLHFSLTIGQQ